MLAYYSNDCFGILTLNKNIIHANFSTPNRLSKFRLLHTKVDCLCLLVKTCIILEILRYVKYNHATIILQILLLGVLNYLILAH